MDQTKKTFRLYTGVLKAWKDEQTGDQFVSGTTSSTIVDLQGDEITLNALGSMRESALKNMTLFLNHSYQVPEDLFGSCVKADIVEREDDDPTSETFGQKVHDLDIVVKVSPEDENPRAQKTFRAIERGRKLGLSIGAEVTKATTRKNGSGDDVWVIDGIILRESSVVGIPANQRSYLHNALKALKGIPETPDETGIDRELEEKGLGDRVRAGIAKNEERAAAAAEEAAAAAASAAEQVAIDTSADEPETEVVDDSTVAEGLEGLGDVATEVAAEAAAAATDDTPAETHSEPDAASAPEAPAAVAAGATTPAKKEWEWVDQPGDEALSYAYLLESVLAAIGRADNADQVAALQRIASEVQALIASEVQEAADATTSELAASAVPLIQKALDAATTSKSELLELQTKHKALLAEKAQVDELLTQALGHLETALALPVGRKSAVTHVAEAAAADFPWLAPALQKAIAARNPAPTGA